MRLLRPEGLRSRGYHRLDRAEVLADSAHVDVPAFAVRRVLAGQIADRGKVALRVDRGRAHYELPLERVDRNASIGHRAITIGQPVDVRAPQMTLLVVGVDVRLEPYFAVQVDFSGLVERAGIVRIAPRGRLDEVHMAHFPCPGACSRTAIEGAGPFRRGGR